MQLVIKNNKVAAIHDDWQNIAALYPGCEIITHHIVELGTLDPRTAEEKAAVYLDRRRLAYPSIPDQLDMMYWDQVNGTTTWKDAITAVKQAYPQPTKPA